MTTCPWQLYVFSLLYVAAGIVCCFTELVCELGFGGVDDCSAEQSIGGSLIQLMALCLLYVGVLVATLTFAGHRGSLSSETEEQSDESQAKLRRLASVAAQCSAATLAGVIMVGPLEKGGVERGWAHLADMATFALLLVVMWTAVANGGGDRTVAGLADHPCRGLGINPKMLLWIYLIVGVVKLLVISDFVTYHYLEPTGADGEDNELARVLWNFMAVLVLQIVLITFYAIGYGNRVEQEATVVAVTVMSVVSVCVMNWGNKGGGFYAQQLKRQSIIVMVVAVVLAVVAVWGGRRSAARAARNGYAEVGDV